MLQRRSDVRERARSLSSRDMASLSNESRIDLRVLFGLSEELAWRAPRPSEMRSDLARPLLSVLELELGSSPAAARARDLRRKFIVKERAREREVGWP